jgi:hypothetical protein
MIGRKFPLTILNHNKIDNMSLSSKTAQNRLLYNGSKQFDFRKLKKWACVYQIKKKDEEKKKIQFPFFTLCMKNLFCQATAIPFSVIFWYTFSSYI